MTILIFFAVLLVCVLVHEWGHFFAARKSGMLVEEFGFGIPPRLWSWKRGETNYSLNALPIGGFVKIAGENGHVDGVDPAREFDAKPWYLQAAVLVAGVTCNMILAFMLFTAAYTIGMPGPTDSGVPTVVSVRSGFAADSAGIRVGDVVEKIAIDGSELRTFSTEELRQSIQNGAKNIVLTYVHAGEKKTVTLVPKQEGDTRLVGISIENIGTVRMNLWHAMQTAWLQIKTITTAIWQTLASLVGSVFGNSASVGGLMGPVGLAREVKGAATIGFSYLLAFTAAISINLAVLNILPFPALDGGRLLVVLLEALSGKKFSRKVVGIIHAAGFLALLVLMLILTVGDIRRLF